MVLTLVQPASLAAPVAVQQQWTRTAAPRLLPLLPAPLLARLLLARLRLLLLGGSCLVVCRLHLVAALAGLVVALVVVVAS